MHTILAKIRTSMETYNEIGIIVEYKVISVNKVRAATYKTHRDYKKRNNKEISKQKIKL